MSSEFGAETGMAEDTAEASRSQGPASTPFDSLRHVLFADPIRESAMRHWFLLLGMGVCGLGSAQAQTPIDSALYAYIRSIRAIDNHTHAGLPVLPGQPADSDYDALPVGGLPPYSFPARLTPKNPDFITAWRELYGYPYSDRTDEHVRELLALKAKIRAEQGLKYPAWVLDKLGTDIALANRM